MCSIAQLLRSFDMCWIKLLVVYIMQLEQVQMNYTSCTDQEILQQVLPGCYNIKDA